MHCIHTHTQPTNEWMIQKMLEHFIKQHKKGDIIYISHSLLYMVCLGCRICLWIYVYICWIFWIYNEHTFLLFVCCERRMRETEQWDDDDERRRRTTTTATHWFEWLGSFYVLRKLRVNRAKVYEERASERANVPVIKWARESEIAIAHLHTT